MPILFLLIRIYECKSININEVCDVNPFGVEALIAAYNDGEEWLEELNQYLFANYHCLRAYFDKYLPEFPVMPLEGTYLVWVDCSTLKQSSEERQQHDASKIKVESKKLELIYRSGVMEKLVKDSSASISLVRGNG